MEQRSQPNIIVKCLSMKALKVNLITLFDTSGFATTQVVVSVRHPITYNLPTPYQPPKYVKDSYWRE